MNPDVTYGCGYPCTMTPVLTLTCRRPLSVLSVLTTIFHCNVQRSVYCNPFNYSSPSAASIRAQVCIRARLLVVGTCQGVEWRGVQRALHSKIVGLIFPPCLRSVWTLFDPMGAKVCTRANIFSFKMHLSFLEFGDGWGCQKRLRRIQLAASRCLKVTVGNKVRGLAVLYEFLSQT